MKKRFKGVVWRIYRSELGVWTDKEPSMQISLCKMSWALLGLSLAAVGGFILIGLCFLIMAVSWFLGFSPSFRNPKADDTLLKFSCVSHHLYAPGSSLEKNHEFCKVRRYKINNGVLFGLAPWELVLFPIPLLYLMLRVLYLMLRAASHLVDVPFVAIGNFILRLALGARKMRCPVPLDFSDVAHKKS